LRQLFKPDGHTIGWLFLDGSNYTASFRRSRGGEARWHPTLANVMIYLDANATLGHWDVRTNTSTPKFTVRGYTGASFGLGEGNPSQDGRYAAVYATRESDLKKV